MMPDHSQAKARILQLIPAVGWYAHWEYPETEETFSVPLVSWALVEFPDEDRAVVGLDAAWGAFVDFVSGDGSLDDSSGNIFRGYSMDPNTPPEM